MCIFTTADARTLTFWRVWFFLKPIWRSKSIKTSTLHRRFNCSWNRVWRPTAFENQYFHYWGAERDKIIFWLCPTKAIWFYPGDMYQRYLAPIHTQTTSLYLSHVTWNFNFFRLWSLVSEVPVGHCGSGLAHLSQNWSLWTARLTRTLPMATWQPVFRVGWEYHVFAGSGNSTFTGCFKQPVLSPGASCNQFFAGEANMHT